MLEAEKPEVRDMPDRLPSLVVLVGFWVVPAMAGWMAAGVHQRRKRDRAVAIHAALATFVVAYAAAWFFFNVGRMPPYIPGAVADPTIASPRAIAGLAAVTGALVLPGSAVACWLAFRRRLRMLRRPENGPIASSRSGGTVA
jgi:cytochrome bd-type quinol oxidase subunit 1